MEKKYQSIIIVDGVTNGIVSITKHHADDEMEYFRFHMSSDRISPNHFDLKKEDAEDVIRKITHDNPVYIGVTSKLDEVINPFFDSGNFSALL